jgi:hypothetical protein
VTSSDGDRARCPGNERDVPWAPNWKKETEGLGAAGPGVNSTTKEEPTGVDISYGSAKIYLKGA